MSTFDLLFCFFLAHLVLYLFIYPERCFGNKGRMGHKLNGWIGSLVRMVGFDTLVFLRVDG